MDFLIKTVASLTDETAETMLGARLEVRDCCRKVALDFTSPFEPVQYIASILSLLA